MNLKVISVKSYDHRSVSNEGSSLLFRPANLMAVEYKQGYLETKQTKRETQRRVYHHQHNDGLKPNGYPALLLNIHRLMPERRMQKSRLATIVDVTLVCGVSSLVGYHNTRVLPSGTVSVLSYSDTASFKLTSNRTIGLNYRRIRRTALM